LVGNVCKIASPGFERFTFCVFRLGEEVGGLFLQASPCAGMRAGPAGVRDSGYDSLRRRLSILDRLVQTHAVWLQLGLGHQDAVRLLHSQPTGVKASAPAQYTHRKPQPAKSTNQQQCVKTHLITWEINESTLPFRSLVFSMKTHSFIYQFNCKISIKCSQDIDKVINNDFYCKY